jgi:hypothetical protein
LSGEHGLVDGGDLVGEGVHIRGVDGHHRVEEEGEVDALGLDGQLERLSVAIEGPGTFDGGDGDVGFVGAIEETVFEFASRVRWAPFFGQPDKVKSLRRSGEEERWRSASSTVESSRRG